MNKRFLYFYSGVIPGAENHAYVSGTLTLDIKMTSDDIYRDVLAILEDEYGEKYSMLNFNYMGPSDD